VVVLGAHAEQVQGELDRLPVLIVENRQWEEGMSSSIRVGLEALVAGGDEVDGAVIMLCDQPFVTVGVINELVETYRQTGKLIVASGYGEACGVPVLFSNELFVEIAALEGTQGAKLIIANHPSMWLLFVSRRAQLTLIRRRITSDCVRTHDYRKLVKAPRRCPALWRTCCSSRSIRPRCSAIGVSGSSNQMFQGVYSNERSICGASPLTHDREVNREG